MICVAGTATGSFARWADRQARRGAGTAVRPNRSIINSFSGARCRELTEGSGLACRTMFAYVGSAPGGAKPGGAKLVAQTPVLTTPRIVLRGFQATGRDAYTYSCIVN